MMPIKKTEVSVRKSPKRPKINLGKLMVKTWLQNLPSPPEISSRQ